MESLPFLFAADNWEVKSTSVRGTSGDLRHPRRSRYRCSLPGLAGFAGPRCTEPEVPRSGSRISLHGTLGATADKNSSTALRTRTKMRQALAASIWKLLQNSVDAAQNSSTLSADGF